MTVATRYLPYNVTLAPGGDINNPTTTQLAVDDVMLRQIEIRVPPGPLGTVGFYVAYAGAVIVPWADTAQYLVLNDETVIFDANIEVSGHIDVVAYNVGAYQHQLFFRLVATPISLIPRAIPDITLIPIG